MTTRPFLDTTPEDAHIAKWMTDVTKFVEDLVGDEIPPSTPADIKIEAQDNSVKVSWRAVNEIGVSEYQVFRGDQKNFASANVELVATVTQAVNPATTTITYNDPEAFTEKFYFIRAVKGLRRPKVVGSVVGFGVSVSSGSIGSALGGGTGGSISGFTGTIGSMLFVNDSLKIDEDNENFFYNADLKSMVVGSSGLMWGNHTAPDIVLTRDAANVLALKRGTNAQAFRIYETDDPGTPFVAITATVLTSGSDETDRTVYTTASVSPGSNKLILAIVNGLRLAVSPNSAPTFAGNGLTWVQVGTVAYEHAGGETGRTRMSVFRAMGAAPSSGAITFTFPETQARASWSIIEFDNIDTGGANGADAIVQSIISAEATTTNPIATLAAFGSINNATFGTTGWSVGDPTVTPGTGFAELSEDDLPPNGTGVQTEFRLDNDTTVDVTYAPAVRTVIFGIEIKSAFTTAFQTFLEVDALGSTGEAEVMVSDNSGSLRDLAVGTRSGGGDLRLYNAGVERARMTPTAFGLGDGNLAFGANIGVEDTILVRDGAADVLAQKRGTNAQTFRIYESTAAIQAITAVHLVTQAVEGPGTVFTSTSITPTTNKLILAFFNTVRTAVAAADIPTVAGNGLTWVNITDQLFDNAGTDRARVSVFRALGTASSGVVTFTLANDHLRAGWTIVEFDNIDTGGANGADAIVQSAKARFDDGGGETATPLVTLSAFSNVNNATVGFTGLGFPSTTVAPGTGFAELGEATQGNGQGVQSEWRADNDTTVDWTFAASVESGCIAIELKSGLIAGNTRYIEIKGFDSGTSAAEILATTASGATDRPLVIGTQGNADVIIHANDLEVARFKPDGSFAINELNVEEEFFFDAGTIIGADNPGIWMGQGVSRTSANVALRAQNQTLLTVNADTKVVFMTDLTVEYATYSSVDLTWRFRRAVLIDNQSDIIGLTIRGGPTQTNPILTIEKDDLTDLFEVNDDGSVEIFSQTPADAIFFDPGNILGTTNPRIWMGQTATKDSTNFMIGALGTDQTRINAIRTVLITVGNASYLSCSNVGITQIAMDHRLHIDPQEDQVQLLVSGHTTQTNDLFQLQTFDNINVFATNVAGDTTLPLAPVQTSFGGAIVNNIKYAFGGTHVSGGVGSTAALMLMNATLTGLGGDTTSLFGLDVAPGGIVTQAAAESIANIAALNIEEPNITDNLTSGGLITVASTLRIGGAPDEGVANWALNVVSGASNFGGDLIARSNIAQSNVAEGGTAQVVYKTAHETHALANANTSDTTTISIPAGAKLLGASFNVNTAVVDDAGNDTWSAAFITGASESLASGAAAAINTKVNSLTANDEVATATVQIRFTANGGNFTAGVIEIVVYYMELTSLADV